jgi:hypothetical protein
MEKLKHLPGKTIRLIFALGFFLPLLLAGYTGGSIGADVLEGAMIFCMVFLFSFLSYWIVAKVVVQLLEE